MREAALVLGIAAIGGVGAILRFALDGVVQQWRNPEFPAGTLAVNLSGSLALGILDGAGVGGDALLLAGAAALGSFTTFSTWMLEAHRLAEEGALRLAGLNLCLSLAGGLGLFVLGRALGDLL
jgi:CrcB protein